MPHPRYFGEHKQALDFATVLIDTPRECTEGNAANAEPFHDGNEHCTVSRGISCRQVKCFPLQAIDAKTIVFTTAAEKVGVG